MTEPDNELRSARTLDTILIAALIVISRWGLAPAIETTPFHREEARCERIAWAISER